MLVVAYRLPKTLETVPMETDSFFDFDPFEFLSAQPDLLATLSQEGSDCDVRLVSLSDVIGIDFDPLELIAILSGKGSDDDDVLLFSLSNVIGTGALELFPSQS